MPEFDTANALSSGLPAHKTNITQSRITAVDRGSQEPDLMNIGFAYHAA